jgi:hypothetical protein
MTMSSLLDAGVSISTDLHDWDGVNPWHQGSGHGVYSVVALSRLACMFVAGGVVFVPIVRYN